jgi:hypothetical protein
MIDSVYILLCRRRRRRRRREKKNVGHFFFQVLYNFYFMNINTNSRFIYYLQNLVREKQNR